MKSVTLLSNLARRASGIDFSASIRALCSGGGRRQIPVKFNKLSSLSDEQAESVVDGGLKALNPYDPGSKSIKFPMRHVVTSDRQDISATESDRRSHLLCIVRNPIEVKFGEEGVLTSSLVKNPEDLLTSSISVKGDQIGILTVRNEVPFQIDAQKGDLLACDVSGFKPVLDYESAIRQYKLDPIIQFGDQLESEQFVGKIRDAVLSSERMERFYEETTANFTPPTSVLPESATGMIFAQASRVEESSAMHYHPGSRSLLVATTEENSGVLLNFCGTGEDPSKCKDTQIKLPFPPNSLIQLSFPPYVHHKFFGNFVAISYHPKEGDRFLEALRGGDLTEGFLEANTTVSKLEYPAIVSEDLPWINEAVVKDENLGRKGGSR